MPNTTTETGLGTHAAPMSPWPRGCRAATSWCFVSQTQKLRETRCIAISERHHISLWYLFQFDNTPSMWLICLLCCAIVFCRLCVEILTSHDVPWCYNGCSLKTTRRCLLWTIPAFTTSTPTIAVAPRPRKKTKARNKWNKFWISSFPRLAQPPVVSHLGSRISCRLRGVFGGETCEVTCKSPWSSEFGRSFTSFSIVFRVLKTFLVKQIRW